ncbi:hypothetical protein ASJ33_07760 [Dehalococcoides mccartyi]|uniref:zinc ribbon domain-containing protein n=1 Tax=Dehalococcoides TaxID=61434 RepID=UPI00062DC850|nr:MULTISPECIES: zinc ribbon domain-containing protein [Dehalococcoides]APH13057.1 hypothetical protein ASJ33_07760 [Dehalococcoides mccartyi]
MSWFKKHLHWTLVIGLLIIPNVWYASLFITDFYGFTGDTVPDKYGFVIIQIITGLVCIIWPFILSGWVLKQKGRHLAWLLLLFIPSGWISLFILDNHRTNPPSRLPDTKPENPILQPATDADNTAEGVAYCSRCGNKLSPGDLYCRTCGNRVEQTR